MAGWSCLTPDPGRHCCAAAESSAAVPACCARNGRWLCAWWVVDDFRRLPDNPFTIILHTASTDSSIWLLYNELVAAISFVQYNISLCKDKQKYLLPFQVISNCYLPVHDSTAVTVVVTPSLLSKLLDQFVIGQMDRRTSIFKWKRQRPSGPSRPSEDNYACGQWLGRVMENERS